MKSLKRWLSSIAIAVLMMPNFSHAFAKDFSIISATWLQSQGDGRIQWEIDVPVEEFSLSFDAFKLPSGQLSWSSNPVYIPGDLRSYSILTTPNMRYDITMIAYDPNGNIIDDDTVSLSTESSISSTMYESFGIIAADYDANSEALTTILETYSASSNEMPIDYFLFDYNVHDLSTGNFLYSLDDVVVDRSVLEPVEFFESGLEIYISVEAYAADGTIIGNEDITIDTGRRSSSNTGSSNTYDDEYDYDYEYDDYEYDEYDDYDYDYEYDDYNQFWFINSLGVSNGAVDVTWDANFAPEITEFETYYDVYDINGNFIYGSETFYTNGRTNQFTFPPNSVINDNEAQEIVVVVNAYDDFGFLATDSLSHFTGDFFPGDFPQNFGALGLDISHSYGNYSVIDLIVGEKISFYAYSNPSNGFKINDTTWEQFPSELLDCNTSNNGTRYDCKAIAPGDTDVAFISSASDPSGTSFEEYSPSILVYVYDDFGGYDLCPSYQEPSCPNGVVYYPPTADGCFGQPICQNLGQNISAPIQGYEDDVIVRTREEAGITSNIFPDTKTNSLESIAANELYLRGVIGGYQDGEFKGKRLVNRAEAAKFLLLAREILILSGLTEADNPFWDVIISEWYGPYVVTAAEKGIIEGHPDGSFKPGDNVNKAEFLAMLARTFNLERNLDTSMYKGASKWKDSWIGEYAGIAAKYDLFPNHDQSILDPGRKLTRNDVAIAIYQYLRNRNK